MYDPYAEFTKHTLWNGLEVHHVFWDRPWVKLEAVVHAGSREDVHGKAGLAHFVEHLVSQNVPGHSCDSMIRFFDSCGGGAKLGSTGYYSTRYGFEVAANADSLQCALNMFGAMLTGATLSQHIERERSVIEREYNERYPYKEMLEWDLGTRAALYSGHRLGTWCRPLGRPEEFLAITESDLQAYYDKYYVPENMSLAVVGGVASLDLISALKRSPFAVSKDGVRNRIPHPFTPQAPSGERTKVVRVSEYTNLSVDQASYKAAWAFPADFPWHARKVFNTMLRAILFEEVRENLGCSYNFSPGTANFQDLYEYTISGKVSPDAIDSIDSLVQACIEKVPKQHDLFLRKFNALKQGCLMTDLSGQALVESAAEDLAADQRISSLQEFLDELNKVTFSQMAEVAEFLCEERKYTFITRP
ncbi:MAG TPA: pitrilysin family protein [Candidatus Paceibacterota bacterium]|nr:pitrilysin family protein [Candidatus Paceibacterota bacterium]